MTLELLYAPKRIRVRTWDDNGKLRPDTYYEKVRARPRAAGASQDEPGAERQSTEAALRPVPAGARETDPRPEGEKS